MDKQTDITNELTVKKRSQRLRALSGLLVLIVAVIVVTLIADHNSRPSPSVAAAKPIKTASQSAVIVDITSKGFSPQTVLVKPGTTVKWVNQTAAPQSVGANPYPTHTSLSGLLSTSIAPKGSYSFTFQQAGHFGYSDYAQPTYGGAVSVQ